MSGPVSIAVVATAEVEVLEDRVLAGWRGALGGSSALVVAAARVLVATATGTSVAVIAAERAAVDGSRQLDDASAVTAESAPSHPERGQNL